MSDAPDQPKLDAAFDAMAARIRQNNGETFGGAFVIVDPTGRAHELLLLDNSGEPAVFWSLIQTRAQIVLKEIEDAERMGTQGYGRR